MADQLPELSVLRGHWPSDNAGNGSHVVTVNGVRIGGTEPVIIAGPCAVESREQALAIAEAVAASGVKLMRGGVFKPRTNPHSFQGLGEQGLEILSEVRSRFGLGIVTEVMDPRRVEQVAGHADVIQVGSRSMQNFPLLTEVGRSGLPVLLKRGFSATLEEWLCAAEYVAVEGNRDIVLCERGVRASCHWSYARNILDLNVIEPVRRATPLPVIVDPSHATGQWSLVPAMARAALAAGAHGLLVEVVPNGVDRSRLRCDADQGIPPGSLQELVDAARQTRIAELEPAT